MKILMSPLSTLGVLVVVFTALTSYTGSAYAAERCIQLVRQGNVERLFNMCDKCRVASLIRSRPGSSMPKTRSYNIQPGTVFPVPFRGPGRTRITSDRPCPGTDGGTRDLLKEAMRPEQNAASPVCVSLDASDVNNIRLVNDCGTCKAVAIVRQMADGSNATRDYYKVSANANQVIPPRGFQQVGLLGELDCP